MDLNKCKQAIYALAHEVCDNGSQQNELISLIQNAEMVAMKDGISDRQMLREMMGPIIDGLCYGNWPWSLQDLNPHVKK